MARVRIEILSNYKADGLSTKLNLLPSNPSSSDPSSSSEQMLRTFTSISVTAARQGRKERQAPVFSYNLLLCQHSSATGAYLG